MATDKTIRTIFDVKGAEKFKSDLKGISESQKTLRAEMARATAEYQANGDKAEFNRKKIEILTQNIAQQEAKVKSLKTAQEASAKANGESAKETEEFRREVLYAESALVKMQTQLKGATKDLRLQESQLKQTADKLENVSKKTGAIGDGFEKVGQKMTTHVTLPIMAGAAYSIKAASDFESAFAGVRKTIDMTESEAKSMSKAILDMSKTLPSSAVEISKVAEAAGQLGIKKENVLGFTKTIIDLGNATNLSGEQGASSLAKFANITQMSQKDFDRLGSTIVELGNNSATTEADIVAMGMRLAGAGRQAGLSEAEIMSMAAALSSVGIEAEAGGSAMSKMMSRIQLAVETSNGDLSDFARVAGMSAESFANAFRKDAAGALTVFITGLANTQRNGKSAVAVLKDLEIKEIRMRDALLRVSGAGDLLNKSIEMGNKAWEENTALVDEANRRYATSESILLMQKNRLQETAITIGEKLLPHVLNLAEGVADLVEKFNDLDPQTQKAILSALGFAAAIGPLSSVVGKTFNAVSTLTGGMSKLFAKLAEKSAIEGTTSSIGKLLGVLSGKAGLIGVAIAVVGGLAAVALTADEAGNKVRGFSKDIENTKNKLDEQNEKIKVTGILAKQYADELLTLNGIERKSNEDKARMATLVAQLNSLMPELELTLNKQTGALEGNTKELYNNINALLERAKQDAFIAATGDITKTLVDNTIELNKANEEVIAITNELNAKRQAEGVIIRENNTYSGKQITNLTDLELKLGAAQAKVNTYSGALEDNNKQLNDVQNQYQNVFPKIEETHKNTTDSIIEQNSQMSESTLEALQATEQEIIDYYTAIEKETQENLKEMGSIYDEGIRQQEITLAKSKENLRKQIDQYRDWRADLKAVAERVPPDVAAELEKLGPQAAGLIAEMANASDEELLEFVALMQQKHELAVNEADKKMSHLPGAVAARAEEAKQALKEKQPGFRLEGGNTGSVAVEGMREEMAKMRQVGETGGKAGVDGLKSGGSGARATGQQIGASAADGVAVGVGELKDRPVRAVQGVIDEMTGKRHSAKESGREVGAYMGEGLAVGIESKKWRIEQAANNAVTDASRRMRISGLVQSPSRLTMEIGEYLGEGLAVGIENRIPAVGNAASRLIEIANNSMRIPVSTSLAVQAESNARIRSHGNIDVQREIDAKRLGEEFANAIDGRMAVELNGRELGRVVVMQS